MANHVSGFLQNAAECFRAYTQNVPADTAANEQDEELESMQAADEADKQSGLPQQSTTSPTVSKHSKMEVMEGSLKIASAQVVVENTLTEYARSVYQSNINH